MSPSVVNEEPSIHMNQADLDSYTPTMLSKILVHEMGHVIDRASSPEASGYHSDGLQDSYLEKIKEEFANALSNSKIGSELHRLLSHPLLDKYTSEIARRREFVADAFTIFIHHPETFREKFPQTNQYLKNLISRYASDRAGLDRSSESKHGSLEQSNDRRGVSGNKIETREPGDDVRRLSSVGSPLEQIKALAASKNYPGRPNLITAINAILKANSIEQYDEAKVALIIKTLEGMPNKPSSLGEYLLDSLRKFPGG